MARKISSYDSLPQRNKSWYEANRMELIGRRLQEIVFGKGLVSWKPIHHPEGYIDAFGPYHVQKIKTGQLHPRHASNTLFSDYSGSCRDRTQQEESVIYRSGLGSSIFFSTSLAMDRIYKLKFMFGVSLGVRNSGLGDDGLFVSGVYVKHSKRRYDLHLFVNHHYTLEKSTSKLS